MNNENIEPQCGYIYLSLTTIIISMNVLKYPIEVSNSTGKTYYRFPWLFHYHLVTGILIKINYFDVY